MSSTTSEDSTKVDSDISTFSDDHKGLRQRIARHVQEDNTARDILLFLIAFRILNALSIRTFFQPDEYFQSLEPAWQIAFGADSGAWITWEWKNYLRSTIHPFLFAAVYKIFAVVSNILHLSPAYHADLLIAAPKVLQAAIAATGDYYTWKLGQKVYGNRSNEAWAALSLTVLNPWQWFCSTRTLSNCLETTLTTVALHLWPWQWSMETIKQNEVDSERSTSTIEAEAPTEQDEELRRLRTCLLLAAVACVLRPTNILVWACLTCFVLFRVATCERLVSTEWAAAPIWVRVSSVPMLRANKSNRNILIRETAICGILVLIFSANLDRVYYGQWVFPPYRFLYFNIAQSLAVFYGRNAWHYYVSQGFPLLLTTFLPFTITDIYQAIAGPSDPQPATDDSLRSTVRYQLAILTILVPATLSFISHKEVRFLYPLLPSLHVLASSSFTTYFLPAVSPASSVRNTRNSSLKRVVLFLLLGINILIALVSTQYHQPGPLSVLSYLRNEHEEHYLTQPPQSSHIAQADTTMTVGFLMPCHSTPWRSHLVHPGIKAWALGCEPPVHMNASTRAVYRDEADQFYDNPVPFLNTHLGKPPRRRSSFGRTPQEALGMGRLLERGDVAWDGNAGKKFWPDYLVFFEAAEGLLNGAVKKGSGYMECWRGWNSWGHDDSRRRGDVVVWCLRGGEKGKRSA